MALLRMIEHFAHFTGQRCGGIRFEQALNSSLKHSVARDGVIRIT